jgi:hypothetical protein
VALVAPNDGYVHADTELAANWALAGTEISFLKAAQFQPLPVSIQ